LLVCLLGYGAPVAAQGSDRPLPSTRPIGIVYPSEIGRTTTNTQQDDDLAMKAIAEVEQTLRRLGYQVVSRAEVVQKLIDAGVNCAAGVQNCPASEVLKSLDLGAVVLVAIWWDRRPADITIEVTTADATGIAKAKLQGDAGSQVPELVNSALKDLKNGKAVEVGIYSVPIGAEVKLDGDLVGTAPVNAKARPGPHEVIVSYPDYVTTSQHFEVPRGGEAPLRVDVTLERTTASAARAADVPLPPPTRVTPAWDYVLGGALAVAGVGLVISPIATLARDGDCKDGADATGCEQVDFGWRSGLLLAGGVLALTGSVVLFATTPIRACLSTDGEAVHAQLRGSF
jgi:hypothetical protein